MAKRKKQPDQIPEGDSCAQLVPRLERLEQAFKSLTGVTLEQYTESEADNPIVEEKRYQHSIIKVHKSGAIERLSICEWCGAEVNDLSTHKAKCPKRPLW